MSNILYHRHLQCLALANVVAILTRSMQELQDVIVRLKALADEVGLEINESKISNFIEGTRRKTKRKYIL